MSIRFNKPYSTGLELEYIKQAHDKQWLSGDGGFTRRCSEWLDSNTGCLQSMLTQSCTAALEMSAILLDIEAGDEVIMPSYTFVSTANAFVLRGAVPVFVDIRSDTQNIDETLIEESITEKTKAIVPVHYAGVGCAMDEIMQIAEHHDLRVIEDAAQGIMASYRGKALGAIGEMGTFSFHESKNIISGEGGALLINDEHYRERAEMIREKGTDRSKFLRGQVDKYTWVEMGSSYLPSEITAAYLLAQLENAQSITAERLSIWNRYHALFSTGSADGQYTLPVIPDDCEHNAHMYYLKFDSVELRSRVMQALRSEDISAVTHYVPLHSSPAGSRYGKVYGELTQTDITANTLLRFPLWPGLSEPEQEQIAGIVSSCLCSTD